MECVLSSFLSILFNTVLISHDYRTAIHMVTLDVSEGEMADEPP